MDLRLDGARAIVTGGSRGIGLAVARGLLAEGSRVALVARDEQRLKTAADGLRVAAIGADVLAIPADTTDDASVRAMVETVVAAWGGIDVLVNAAAQPSFASAPPALADITDAEVATDFDTKVLGYLRCARAVAPHMIAQGSGRIVNISGLNARRTGSISGTIRNVAVAALTANLADELGPHGVGVTVVHPGLVETERTPRLVADRAAATGLTEDQVRAGLGETTSLRRLVTAEEVADVVVFLCSERAAAVTGDAVSVAGGNRGAVHY
ncbi:NAD(P)-dependent dehydrogenase (short-subunit alcohol dehydrogenase family) [Thermocatellispora tengchongensis]|uniref:NAD(P)-dependent dehydrogenase (Short-subunit alcohol dehydrogenase family) n=1 Tax=Thermocatellispora tengchongensis TaxID=1073253 RepID=A0A840P8K5_9ACTN|nr:SDR family oxidoreductase [Thermocatellispora tengchongensis]MBB5135622.1 NAD(P)-dependent dehydrogenase (short-subunit alcohol dehydrogenase family) [Thermocatellispora tengchongensis]